MYDNVAAIYKCRRTHCCQLDFVSCAKAEAHLQGLGFKSNPLLFSDETTRSRLTYSKDVGGTFHDNAGPFGSSRQIGKPSMPRSHAHPNSIFPPPLTPAEARLQQQALELKKTQKKLKAISRARAGDQQPWLPSVALRRQAALVYDLCRDEAWAIAYVKMQQQTHMPRTLRMPRNTDATNIREWHHEFRENKDFKIAQRRLEHRERVAVDDFLVQSIVYEFVQKQSTLGLVVASSAVVAKYLSLWNYRPKPQQIILAMDAMQRKASRRHAWCRRFRKRWRLEWGITPSGKGISQTEMQKKVDIC